MSPAQRFFRTYLWSLSGSAVMGACFAALLYRLNPKYALPFVFGGVIAVLVCTFFIAVGCAYAHAQYMKGKG